MAPILQAPLQGSSFSLDASGVAGFFGGDEAISAMSTVHLFKGRRWVGWFNSPGSYTIGKCYGRLANSRWWDGLFPGPNHTPARTFGLDGKKGPNYVGTCSGTRMMTGHLGHLFLEKCKEPDQKVEVPARRKTTPHRVSIVELKHDPIANVPIGSVVPALLALIPIVTSFITCVVCALAEEWWAASMILLGIVANGVSCYVIGSGKVTLEWHNKPSQGVPPGDGFLHGESSDTAVVLGREDVVNVLTKGRFKIKLQGDPEYPRVGLAALLLETQFFFQLLLIPQSKLFGQIMFVSSLAVSWMYTSYLSSKEKEKIQCDILWGALHRPKVRQYSLGTRCSFATFTTLILNPTDPEKVLAEFVGNDTRVWGKWRKTISDRIKSGDKLKFDSADWDLEDLGEDERSLYKELLWSAEDAYVGYQRYLVDKKEDEQKQAEQALEKKPTRSRTWTLMSMSTLVSPRRASTGSMGEKMGKISARSMSTLTPSRRQTPDLDLEKGEISMSDVETQEASEPERSSVA